MATLKNVQVNPKKNDRTAKKFVVYFDDGSTEEYEEGCLVRTVDNGDTATLSMLPINMDGEAMVFLLYLIASAYVEMGGEL